MPFSRLKAVLHIYAVPTHLQVITRQMRGRLPAPCEPREHLAAVMDWLRRAQDVSGTGGVAGSYSFSYKGGWMPPYPETTGYIIPTFIEYARLTGESDFLDRAVRMGEWEMSIQLPGGGLNEGMGINDIPSVFVSGQVILGWMALYHETERKDFLEAAVRAADWLLSVQDDDGKWCRYTLYNISHTYYSRVAWSLIEVYRITGEKRYLDAAEANVRWTMTQAGENGWFENAAFREGALPFTHTIAYTLRGLLESVNAMSGELGNDVLRTVGKGAERMLMLFERGKKDPKAMPPLPPGRFDSRWRSEGRFSCLTGDAQTALIWLKLYRDHGFDARYLNGALKIVELLESTQTLDSANPGIRGGIAGSYPVWGGYIRYGFPNWAAKFYADAEMLLDNTMKDLKGVSP